MSNLSIDRFTDQVMKKEKFLSFFIWKTAKKYGVTLDGPEIEDIFGDAYLAAATKLKHQSNLEVHYPMAWFSRIVHLTTMNAIRSRFKKQLQIDSAVLDELEASNFVYETIEANDNSKFLETLMEKSLSQEEMTIIKMNVEGYSYREIAAHFGKTNAAIRQIASRTVKKLKRMLS